MHRIRCRLGLRPDPARGAYSAPPDVLSGFSVLLLRYGWEGKGRKGREKEERVGRGEEGKERDYAVQKIPWNMPCVVLRYELATLEDIPPKSLSNSLLPFKNANRASAACRWFKLMRIRQLKLSLSISLSLSLSDMFSFRLSELQPEA